MRVEEEQRIKRYLFGRKLSYLREMLGVSKAQLSRRLNVGESYIAEVECGTRVLCAVELPTYAHALGFDTSLLCSVIDEVERTWREV